MGNRIDSVRTFLNKVHILNPVSGSVVVSGDRLSYAADVIAAIQVEGEQYIFGGYDFGNTDTWAKHVFYTQSPTSAPSPAPTTPTSNPSPAPSDAPSQSTINPTNNPSVNPTSSPTIEPTLSTGNPTKYPSLSPTKEPTPSPTQNPTKNPSLGPTKFPSLDPTISPTFSPTNTTISNEEKDDDADGALPAYFWVICVIMLVFSISVCCYIGIAYKNRKNIKEVDVAAAEQQPNDFMFGADAQQNYGSLLVNDETNNGHAIVNDTKQPYDTNQGNEGGEGDVVEGVNEYQRIQEILQSIYDNDYEECLMRFKKEMVNDEKVFDDEQFMSRYDIDHPFWKELIPETAARFDFFGKARKEKVTFM